MHLFFSHVLECIQQLCNYRIYYAFDYAVRTAEIILKNVFCQIQENNFEVLNLALKIIISIVEKYVLCLIKLIKR